MATYRLTISSGADRWKKNCKETPVGQPARTLESARKEAVRILTANNVKGQIIYVYKDGEWCGTVSMQIDSDVYVKPSVGLATGVNFMYDDGNVFYTCFKTGKVKRW